MNSTVLIGLALAAVAAVAIAAKIPKGNAKAKKGTFGARTLATVNEQNMYWRLVDAFPPSQYIVLVQVSFGALLTAKGGANRNSFSQKIADFVLTDKAFKVLAAIELDDKSHNGKEKQDAERDAMLIAAGYKVLRYAKMPDVGTLRADLAGKSEPEATAPMPLISKR